MTRPAEVTLQGFYDGVEETPAQILSSWESLGRSAEQFLGEVGPSVPSGEQGRSVLELTWARPTAEVNGMWGGYTGEGFKTVIAAQASAKVSFRLVGQQDPRSGPCRLPRPCRIPPSRRLHRQLRPPWRLAGDPAGLDSPVVTRTRAALTDEWPKPAVMIGMGGSIPISATSRTSWGCSLCCADSA